MELQRTVTPDISLASEAQVLNYVYSGTPPIEVIARIDLGDATKPIAGNGTYTLNFYINDTLVTPVSTSQVPAGVVRTVVIGRPVPISNGDKITLKVVGQAGDTDVDVTATLRTATPIQTSDIYGGGPTPVDHNFGGANNLAYLTAAGVGIPNADVRVYLKSDYDAGNRSAAYIVARSTTTTGGAWFRPVMLNPGTYTLVYSSQMFGPDTIQITV